jgi:hypothetical protein
MATFLLREQLLGLTKIGIVLALIALVFFNILGGSGDAEVGPWLILALLITVAWGVQAYYMRKGRRRRTSRHRIENVRRFPRKERTNRPHSGRLPVSN